MKDGNETVTKKSRFAICLILTSKMPNKIPRRCRIICIYQKKVVPLQAN